MNAVNSLFVISAMMVPLIRLSVNYSAINDFYSYSWPLIGSEISRDFQDSPERFEKIRSMKDSTCFTTPSSNEFCYEKPRTNSPIIVS